MFDLIIVGAGTAGMSAAIYARRSGKSVLMLEKTSYGGQIISTPEVVNYPGIKNISGFDFATGLYEHALALGADLSYTHVIGIQKGCPEDPDGFTVLTSTEELSCRAVILATGAKNRPLGLQGEQELIGSGISYCATCDGGFYRKKVVAVNGGGNTALEDAMYLSNLCSHVYLIHRRDTFRGEAALSEALAAKENVTFILNSEITALIPTYGSDIPGTNIRRTTLSSIFIRNRVTGEETALNVDGLFIAIGQMPDNTAFSSLVNIDEKGYIIAGENCLTNVPGIFAAGDCRTKEVRQLTTAAADGAVSATAACAYIDRNGR